jgi:flagellar biosynthesis/type III secretory pathway protein FliH
MELNELEQAFVTASAEITVARENLFDASEKVIHARELLESAKMEAMQSGRVDGKNETERKAQLVEQTHAEIERLSEAERKERLARAVYDADMFAFDILRYRLRIAELLNK